MNDLDVTIDRLRDLDAKRTQCKVTAEQFTKAPATEKAKAIDTWKLRPFQRRVLGSFDRDDALFLEALANEALPVIYTLRAENARLLQAVADGGLRAGELTAKVIDLERRLAWIKAATALGYKGTDELYKRACKLNIRSKGEQ